MDLNVCAAENAKIMRHLEAGGIRTLLYGGNAVFYHIALAEYADTLAMLQEQAGADTTVVPSVGPAYGTSMDQAAVLRDFDFPTVMVLPARDIATPKGAPRASANSPRPTANRLCSTSSLKAIWSRKTRRRWLMMVS